MSAPDCYAHGLPLLWLPHAQMMTATPPLAAVRVQGSRIVLADGRELVDGTASRATAVQGANHPHILAAIERALRATPPTMLGDLVHEQAATLAARLAALLPGDLDHVCLSDSGSVAVEVAMKMAVQYWLSRGETRRTKFVAFSDGQRTESEDAPFADPGPAQHIRDLPRDDESEAALHAFLSAHAPELAGIIVEPLVQVAGGMIFNDEMCLRRLRRAADAHGLILVFDETFTGFARTGPMFACNIEGALPDIIALGAALSGGALPLAATVASERIFDSFRSDDALLTDQTFAANAFACAAANASLDLFEREPRCLQSAEVAKKLTHGLGPCIELPGVTDVRVRGAIGVVELDEIADRNALQRRFVDAGTWIRPFRNIVYLTPALTIADEDLALLTGAVVRVLTDSCG